MSVINKFFSFFSRSIPKPSFEIRPFDLFGSEMMRFPEEEGAKLPFRTGKRGLSFQNIADLEELNLLLCDFNLFAEYGPNFENQAMYSEATSNLIRLVKIESKRGYKKDFSKNLKRATVFLSKNDYLKVFYWP